MSNIVSTDPIADMLTRIRNAIAVRKGEIALPHSNLKEAVAQLLKKQNYIDAVTVTGEGKTKTLIVTINQAGANARVTEIKSLSKPGRRVYANAQEIPVVMRGRGIVIVSTSKGLMTGKDAKRAGIGGEVICSVY